MTKIIIVDEQDKIVRYQERDVADAISPKDIYRVSALWILNSKNEALIAQRAFTKKNGSGLWQPAVAGTNEENETYESNIIKETTEELGIVIDTHDLKPLPKRRISQSTGRNFFSQTYLLYLNQRISDFVIRKEEVEAVRWVSLDQLTAGVFERPEIFVPGMPEVLHFITQLVPFQNIYELSLPYIDQRDDSGHNDTVIQYALRLMEKYRSRDDYEHVVNPRVIIPAVILHDVGWSRLTYEERMSIFGKIQRGELWTRMKKLYEERGAKFARELLQKVRYPEDLTSEITEIIAGYDTREGFLSVNDGIVRDADKLWRYSAMGFLTDVKRNNVTPEHLLDHLKKRIDSSGFFYSEFAKEIVWDELNHLKL